MSDLVIRLRSTGCPLDDDAADRIEELENALKRHIEEYIPHMMEQDDKIKSAEARVKELEAVVRGIHGLAAAQDEGHVGHSIFGTIVSICEAALASGEGKGAEQKISAQDKRPTVQLSADQVTAAVKVLRQSMACRSDIHPRTQDDLIERFREAAVELVALPALTERNISALSWQPMDTAPLDGTDILILIPQNEKTHLERARVQIARWRKGYGFRHTNGYRWTSYPSEFDSEDLLGWQPLPSIDASVPEHAALASGEGKQFAENAKCSAPETTDEPLSERAMPKPTVLTAARVKEWADEPAVKAAVKLPNTAPVPSENMPSPDTCLTQHHITTDELAAINKHWQQRAIDAEEMLREVETGLAYEVGETGCTFPRVGTKKLLDRVRAVLKGAVPAQKILDPSVVSWAFERWNAEVANRPLQNIHRRTLDDTWRQVMRRFGGDPVALCGPAHDDLLASPLVSEQIMPSPQNGEG